MARAVRGLGVALAAVTVLVAPAGADETGMFNSSLGNCGPGWRQHCAGYGQGALVGLGSLTVTLSCTATSPFAVDRTGVGCFLVGADGREYLRTGPRYVTGNVATVTNAGSVPLQAYVLCVGGGYSTPDDAGFPVQNYRCR